MRRLYAAPVTKDITDTPTRLKPVTEWIGSMEDHDIEYVCCLLNNTLAVYPDLIEEHETRGSNSIRVDKI